LVKDSVPGSTTDELAPSKPKPSRIYPTTHPDGGMFDKAPRWPAGGIGGDRSHAIVKLPVLASPSNRFPTTLTVTVIEALVVGLVPGHER